MKNLVLDFEIQIEISSTSNTNELTEYNQSTIVISPKYKRNINLRQS